MERQGKTVFVPDGFDHFRPLFKFSLEYLSYCLDYNFPAFFSISPFFPPKFSGKWANFTQYSKFPTIWTARGKLFLSPTVWTIFDLSANFHQNISCIGKITAFQLFSSPYPPYFPLSLGGNGLILLNIRNFPLFGPPGENYSCPRRFGSFFTSLQIFINLSLILVKLQLSELFAPHIPLYFTMSP